MTIKCLVLGGNGFIGTNLINRLIKDKKIETTIFDKYLPNNLCSEVKFIQGDFFNDDILRKSLSGIDVVIHLVCTVTPKSSMDESLKAYSDDLLQTIKLIRLCRNKGINKIIFISSGGTVYGDNGRILNKEDSPTNPINNYGIMKLSIEKALLMYNKHYGMQNVILRVANPYGNGQKPESQIGAVTIFLYNILNDLTINIFGNGEIVRDYIEITDVVEGIYKSIFYKSDDSFKNIFNIGTGQGTSLNQLIKNIEEITNKRSKIYYEKERFIDVPYNILDISKAANELGFKANIKLKEGIKKYHDFLLRR